MKKTIKIAALMLVVVMAVFAFASCAKRLSGTYKAESFIGSTTYTFNGKNVEVTYEIGGFEKTSEGTYEIGENDEGDSIITFTFEDDDAESYEGEFSFAEGEEDGVKYIKIGGVKYTKQ